MLQAPPAIFSRDLYERLVQESADAVYYAKIISGVAPVAFSEAETEIRLRAYAPRQTHDSGVHDRVKTFFLRNPKTDVVEREVTTVHLYEDNMRRIVNETTLDEQYQRKTELFKKDNSDFNVRSVVSREDTLSAGFAISAPAFQVRKRDRTRITYEGLFIDLTTVTMSKKAEAGSRDSYGRGGGWRGSGGRTFGGRGYQGRGGGRFGGGAATCPPEEPAVRYEVEIEIPNIGSYGYPKLNQIIRTIFRVVRQTEVAYPVSFYAMMAEFYNSTLGQDMGAAQLDTGDFDTRRLQSRARPLKLKDLVYGGIVGEKTHYSVTPKADGVRTAFMIHKSGLWLFSGNGLLNCLVLSHDYSDQHGVILDVESIPRESRTAAFAKKFQYFLVAFDTLAVGSNFMRGATSVQDEDHVIRMTVAERIFAGITDRVAVSNPTLLLLRTKTFYYSETVDQFFDSVAKARHLLDSGVLPYKTDGLVFTPSNLRSIPYAKIHLVKLDKRILPDYPDIVKFKPVSQLTIDFSVNVGNRQILSSGPGGSLVPFTAKGFNSTVNVAWIDCEQKDIPRNAIFEFEWRDEQFHPLRPRSDKDAPNRLDVARDNFVHIKEDVTYDTVGGLTNVLMFKYHNRVKTLLYSTAAAARARLFPDAKRDSHYSLLDLGAGVGGDINKWKNAGFTHVIAVEPSPSNIAEFR